ncbi:hypothetical protein RRG08_060939 [Elysia crispata]|uniref:Uncharacterized protein n=1 Tax=Elysia crispata TaxID=231223 RepID=A0AAE1AUR6_9GAST|nr:hypothetical protein RRG08_060939 [Elysia crispata]
MLDAGMAGLKPHTCQTISAPWMDQERMCSEQQISWNRELRLCYRDGMCCSMYDGNFPPICLACAERDRTCQSVRAGDLHPCLDTT